MLLLVEQDESYLQNFSSHLLVDEMEIPNNPDLKLNKRIF